MERIQIIIFGALLAVVLALIFLLMRNGYGLAIIIITIVFIADIL
jgi:hypothetical protein